MAKKSGRRTIANAAAVAFGAMVFAAATRRADGSPRNPTKKRKQVGTPLRCGKCARAGGTLVLVAERYFHDYCARRPRKPEVASADWQRGPGFTIGHAPITRHPATHGRRPNP